MVAGIVSGQSSRPSHLIAPDEVAAWLADSANQRVTYHRTMRTAADDILRRGIDVTRSRIGAYGQGFYTATVAEPQPGQVVLAVAIRTTTPLRGQADEIGPFIDGLVTRLFRRPTPISPSVAAAIRRELLALGYDSLMIDDAGGDGIDYVVALDASSVKVVW
jgi:hypothetical protein